MVKSSDIMHNQSEKDVHTQCGRFFCSLSFDGDHRSIDVYEDLDLVVYLEEIEPEGE